MFDNTSAQTDAVFPIVSLTSYPARLPYIAPCLDSLLQQTAKTKKIILWLSYEEFPDGEASLPQNLLAYKGQGLSIEWCHNIKSYKKLIPALLTYPDDVIVTADDDIVYPKDWLERLVNAYKERPDCVNALRVHKIAKCCGIIQKYLNWTLCSEEYQKPSFNNFATGVGGVIYTKDLFYKDILNETIFTRLCPTGDDIWFWAMAVMRGSKTRLVKPAYNNLESIEGTQDEALWKINVAGGNDLALKKVLMYYPEITKKVANNKNIFWYVNMVLKSLNVQEYIIQKPKLFIKGLLYKSEMGKNMYDKLKGLKTRCFRGGRLKRLLIPKLIGKSAMHKAGPLVQGPMVD